MNTKITKTVGALTPFLIGCIILSGIGCKKELGITENNRAISQTAAQAISAPVAVSSNSTISAPVTVSSNSIINIDLAVFIPCANGGAGETAVLSGPLHILTTFTISGNHISGKDHYQPQGISGTGDITGFKYQATGITEDEFTGTLINGQYQVTNVNNFRIIGQGPGNNFLVHFTLHETFNANGVLTSFVDNFSSECK
jgi:hypothetical protein